jgi:multiple sugar transport system permease protein
MAERPQGPIPAGAGLEAPRTRPRTRDRLEARLERAAPTTFVLPAVLVVLLFSIFPLVLSLYISLVSLQFVPGGFQLSFVGLRNYADLVVGINRSEFLGVLAPPGLLGWFVFALAVACLTLWLIQHTRRPHAPPRGLLGRVAFAVLAAAGVWLLVRTLAPAGRPGSLVVTMIYVGVGVAVQYVLGLGLALLCAQRIPWRRFFRVVFLLPMMITPVGIAYTFRMLTDTSKGPFFPIWKLLGLSAFSWVTIPWGARGAVMIGDTWQWTPFMFIVLLAALESQPVEPLEAAVVDGASAWQVFREITLPAILPVSSTLILIRTIEAFKIIDLPNVLTSGGPGTATESLTLHAYVIWRGLDIGGSAAIAYILLLVVTCVAISYVHLVHRRVTDVV